MLFKIYILYYLLEYQLKFLFAKKEISKLQKVRWRKMKQYLLKSPFYKPFIQKDYAFGEFPLMNKEKFMTNFDTINTEGIKLKEANKIALQAEESRNFKPMIGDVSVGLSSGTSGNRGIFLANEKERARWVAMVLIKVIGISFRPRTIAFFLRANNQLYEAVKSRLIKFDFFDLYKDMDSHIQKLNKIKPDILLAPPSVLILLAKAVEKGDLKIHPSKIISVAEVLYPEDRIYLEAIFEKIIHQVYQCTEGFLASTCENGVLHFHEDHLIIEKKYIGEDKKRFYPVISDLLRMSQPVIRYELNDIIVEKQACACNRMGMAIERVEGRSDDVLIFNNREGKEVPFFPDYFRRAIIKADEDIREYILTRVAESKIEIYLEGKASSYLKVANKLNTLFEKYEVKAPEIEFVDKIDMKKGSKLRRIKNDIK